MSLGKWLGADHNFTVRQEVVGKVYYSIMMCTNFAPCAYL